jgi:hypothetical protein
VSARTPDPIRRGAARTATLVAAPVALLIALVSLWVFGGFSVFSHPAPAPSASPTPQASSLVSLPAPALAEDVVGVCRQVVAALPETVLGSHRRPVSGPEQNAAYGDPPVTLACGVSAAVVAPTDVVTQISGVCWIAKPGTANTVWTTVDRSVPIAVTVPGQSGGSGQPVVSFVDSIKANDPVAAHYPTGCTA